MKLLIFGLHGTLIDSRLDVAHSLNATLAHAGMPAIAHDLVATYVGSGPRVMMGRALGPNATDKQVREALQYFTRYYAEHCLDNTSLYPGVKAALDRLRDDGKVRMAVLTNERVPVTNHIIAGLGCDSHFFRVYGGDSFRDEARDVYGTGYIVLATRKKPDPMGIELLLNEFSRKYTTPATYNLMKAEHNLHRETAVMVGDGAVDIRTARNARIRACGVSYGFEPETFADQPPDFIIDDLRQLPDLL